MVRAERLKDEPSDANNTKSWDTTTFPLYLPVDNRMSIGEDPSYLSPSIFCLVNEKEKLRSEYEY